MRRRKKTVAEIEAEVRAFGSEELPRLINELNESTLRANARFEADVAAARGRLSTDEKLLSTMATAEVKAERWFAERGVSVEAICDFLMEDDDAIASPTLLKLLLSLRAADRDSKAQHGNGTTCIRETLLGPFLRAYATPGLSKRTKAAIEVIELEGERSRARIESATKNMSASTLFEKLAAAAGRTKPSPNTEVPAAAARREQRARKRAGLPARPPGRPRRSD